jgi:hypothetical protein
MKLIKELAGLTNMLTADACFQIGEYEKRCDIAYKTTKDGQEENVKALEIYPVVVEYPIVVEYRVVVEYPVVVE